MDKLVKADTEDVYLYTISLPAVVVEDKNTFFEDIEFSLMRQYKDMLNSFYILWARNKTETGE